MECTGDFLAGQYENRNFRFGVREFGMGAVANALALHKSGIIPYCATFLIFSDYMRNAIRIAALSQVSCVRAGFKSRPTTIPPPHPFTWTSWSLELFQISKMMGKITNVSLAFLGVCFICSLS